MKGNGNDQRIKLTFPYWTPTFAALSLFILTLQLSHYHLRANSDSSADETEDPGYLSSFYTILEEIELAFLGLVFLGNAVYGKKPDISDHHNPPNHRIGQVVEGFLPMANAVAYSAFNFLMPSRAAAVAPLLSEALIIEDAIVRADLVEGELYSDIMDRSLHLDGNVRRIDYGPILWQRAVTFIGEGAGYYLIFAMKSGMTRINVNDKNILYILAGMYRVMTMLESLCVYPVDQYAYYLQRLIDDTPLGSLLRAIGIADPDHPIHAVDVSMIDKWNKKFAERAEKDKQKINDEVHKVGEAMASAVHTVEHELQEFGSSVMDALHIGHRKPSTAEAKSSGDTENDRKLTAAEYDEMKAKEAEEAEAKHPGAAAPNNSHHEAAHYEGRTDAVARGRDFISSLFDQRSNESRLFRDDEETPPSDFSPYRVSLEENVLHIHIPNGVELAIHRVNAAGLHHGGALGFMNPNQHILARGITSYHTEDDHGQEVLLLRFLHHIEGTDEYYQMTFTGHTNPAFDCSHPK